MKNIILLISAISIFCISCDKERTYCGKIKEKYLLHKNNGGVYNIVFYCDSLHKNINVSVTADCHVNSNVGENICFELLPYQTK